jgi:hypothetical protein
MSQGPDEFDLDAAVLRRSQVDIRAFMEALAVRLEGALPGRVTVERRRDGLLSKTSHVAKITVVGEKATYVISNDKAGLSASRAKTVRGVTISSSIVPVPEWLNLLRAEVRTLAEEHGEASDVLHGFL